ncbi:MAG: PspC domain-containing protein [Patescibacteria group bacterium]|mgnify:CR=1 FL=1
MTKQLFRSRTNKVFAGVMGGLGEYFDVDPAAIRLIYTILTVFTGFVPGIITYVFAILIVPSRPTVVSAEHVTGVKDDSGAV